MNLTNYGSATNEEDKCVTKTPVERGGADDGIGTAPLFVVRTPTFLPARASKAPLP